MDTKKPDVLRLRRGEGLPDFDYMYPGGEWTDSKGNWHREVLTTPYRNAVMMGLVVIEWIDDPATAKEANP